MHREVKPDFICIISYQILFSTMDISFSSLEWESDNEGPLDTSSPSGAQESVEVGATAAENLQSGGEDGVDQHSSGGDSLSPLWPGWDRSHRDSFECAQVMEPSGTPESVDGEEGSEPYSSPIIFNPPEPKNRSVATQTVARRLVFPDE